MPPDAAHRGLPVARAALEHALPGGARVLVADHRRLDGPGVEQHVRHLGPALGIGDGQPALGSSGSGASSVCTASISWNASSRASWRASPWSMAEL
jgi:hypothetical protein